MSCWSTVTLLVVTMVVILTIQTHSTEAKRGCANFGHSCYGGMGKRATDIINPNEEILQDIQTDEDPAFVFTGPRSEYKPERSQRLTPQQYDNISRMIRQWIQYSRRSQELHGDNI